MGVNKNGTAPAAKGAVQQFQSGYPSHGYAFYHGQQQQRQQFLETSMYTSAYGQLPTPSQQPPPDQQTQTQVPTSASGGYKYQVQQPQRTNPNNAQPAAEGFHGQGGLDRGQIPTTSQEPPLPPPSAGLRNAGSMAPHQGTGKST